MAPKKQLPAVLILAAGQGKRMKSSLPKVLSTVSGRPLILHILYQIQKVLPGSRVGIVVGFGKELVEEAIKQDEIFSKMQIEFITQQERDGTGGAARVAMNSTWGQKVLKDKSEVLVLPGDLPLISTAMIEQISEPLSSSSALRLLTCILPDPTGYGRIVRRGKKGALLRIVEEKDATNREKTIREVAVSIYLFNSIFLNAGLQRITNKNAQKEYYLPDLIALAVQRKKKIELLEWSSFEDLRGINDPWELADAQKILNQRILKSWAKLGVRFVDPDTTWVGVDVELGEDVVIHPGVILQGRTKIGSQTEVGPYSVLSDMIVAEKVVIKTGTVGESSRIESGAHVGPYARLRPDSVVGQDAKIGNFVELKKTTIGSKTSVAHLSYLGDAEVGKNVNIGCGFITCNFDGRVIDGERKHKTVIEDGVFMGSDCQTVAPVKIGKGSYVASGSTITEDVESESLAIARSRQVNKIGYAKKLKE